jgi:hypothetical protein
MTYAAPDPPTRAEADRDADQDRRDQLARDLSALIKDVFYASRDHGRTMHQAADEAADRILAAGWHQ